MNGNIPLSTKRWKSRETLFFLMFWGSGGSKRGSLKRRVRSHLARWEMKTVHRCGTKHISKSKCWKHTNYSTLQLHLQLHYTRLHHTTSTSCGWGDHFNHSKKHNSNHLLVHQWICSAIHASQHITLVSYLWNFRHRLVRYCWYY